MSKYALCVPFSKVKYVLQVDTTFLCHVILLPPTEMHTICCCCNEISTCKELMSTTHFSRTGFVKYNSYYYLKNMVHTGTASFLVE